MTFELHGAQLSARCTCTAGLIGQSCKHRLSILGGSASGILSGNAGDVSTVVSWLPGSDLSRALDTLRSAERDLAIAQKAVASAKKRVADAMR